MRLFIAIELPSELRRRLAKLMNHYQNLIQGKWVELANLHITFTFIGEVSPNKINDLKAKLKQSIYSFPTFSLQTTNLITLPPQNARLLAVGINFPLVYKKMQNQIFNNLKKLNLNIQNHDPHITLVRFKNPCRNLKFDYQLPPSSFKVQSLTLMTSTLTNDGPIYKPLEGLKLASNEPQGQFRPNISICLVNPKNEVLIIKSSRHGPNDWQLPQGGIEKNESLAQAAARELKEEVGIAKARLLVLQSNIYKYKWKKKYPFDRSEHNKQNYVGQLQSLAIMKIKAVRPVLHHHPREATFYKWVPYHKLLTSTARKRQGLTRLAVVELNKLINNQSLNGQS